MSKIKIDLPDQMIEKSNLPISGNAGPDFRQRAAERSVYRI
jgi:hypothetical protein